MNLTPIQREVPIAVVALSDGVGSLTGAQGANLATPHACRRLLSGSMPATPAWPPASLPRLFVAETLAEGLALPLEGAPANYLANVLRLGPGAQVKLFDDRTGEWLAEIAEAGKKRVTLTVGLRLRERETVPDLWLLFAPIKRGRIDWLVEKATELGVARLVPVLTRRTVVDRLNLDRLRAHIVEAAEQCERTTLTELDEPQTLEVLLAGWPAGRLLYFADEAGGAPLQAGPGPAGILIGPEGGFTDEERAAIRALPQARPVSLGPRILRADTAALAATALWMGQAGDWGSSPPRRGGRGGG
jgi:16S rRNA (uracil1498-N3)-methyltransferase